MPSWTASSNGQERCGDRDGRDDQTSLITGITGQDGSYLAEFLLDKGYEVHGLIRRSSTFSTGRLDHLYRDPHDPDANPLCTTATCSIRRRSSTRSSGSEPDEVYNLGAQSHVKVSFEMPEFTAEATGHGHAADPRGRPPRGLADPLLPGGSSEMFGQVVERPQTERTPFYPRSPYAVAKVFAHWMTVQYREAYGLFGSNGILFNHESPRRGGTFVTRK